MRSGSVVSAFSRAVSPSEAVSTLKPCRFRASQTSSDIAVSSSTTRIRSPAKAYSSRFLLNSLAFACLPVTM